jgi:hypothetical protein
MTERRFSDRIGATIPRDVFQLEDMDNALRASLWNWFTDLMSKEQRVGESYWARATKDIYQNFLKRPVDEIPYYDHERREKLKPLFMEARWFQVYNLLEFVLPRTGAYRGLRADYSGNVNAILAREMSGYRWIAGALSPITSADELASVTAAASVRTGYEGVATHIGTAAALLGKRPDPDLRNSIKESISAVESAVKLVTGENSGGIDKALAVIEKRGTLHPAFKSALSKLYGYTSDKDGVRHAILEQSSVTFGEAKFMLVACSAFVNLVLDAASVRS